MSNYSNMQLHTKSLQQQSQVIDFVKRNGKNCLEISEVFSILLLFFSIIGLPSTAFAKDTYSSNVIPKQSLNNHQSLINEIKDSTKGIFIADLSNQQLAQQQQQQWAEQQRQTSEQFTERQQQWAEQQRRASEQFAEQQQQWAEEQRRASEQFTERQQQWAERQRQNSEQLTQQQRDWVQRHSENWGQQTGQKWEWEWKWETKF